ncbi:unnamed protein product [Penicillium pancosmium]
MQYAYRVIENFQDAARPVLFVAHCLGGLALVEAKKDSKKVQFIESIKSVVLLGTPHYKADTLSKAKAYFDLVGSKHGGCNLESGCEHIVTIPQDFARFVKSNDIDVRTFFGVAPVKTESGNIRVIDKSDAQFFIDAASPASLRGNHNKICRFESANDNDFIKVGNALLDFVGDLSQLGKKPALGKNNYTTFGANNRGLQMTENNGPINGLHFGDRHGC